MILGMSLMAEKISINGPKTLLFSLLSFTNSASVGGVSSVL